MWRILAVVSHRHGLGYGGLLMNVALAVLLLGGMVTSAERARGQDVSRNSPAYDAASIRPVKPGGSTLGTPGIINTPDGLTGRQITVRYLIHMAYNVQARQVTGEPQWCDSEQYDIDAKMDPAFAEELQKIGEKKSASQRQIMLQNLLKQRFNLAFHMDSRELPVYLLEVAKNGPKLRQAMPGYVGPGDMSDAEGKRATDAVFISFGGAVAGQAASLSTLANALSRQLDRPVLDKTGITGTFYFTFKFSPDRLSVPSATAATGQPAPVPSDPNGPNLEDALRDNLGLKLEKGKGLVEMFVVDRIDRPLNRGMK